MTSKNKLGNATKTAPPLKKLAQRKLVQGTLAQLVAPTEDTLPVHVQLPNDPAPERFKIMEILLPK